MGDLLIRNLDDALKDKLQESAKRSGRSLSEEALYLIRRELAAHRSAASAGERLKAVLGNERLTEDEVAAIDASRYEIERDPPQFDL